MPEPSKAPRIRFGAFDFDQESGELWRVEEWRRVVVRLPPQPARLLSHLIERRPHLVPQDEIKRLLWPGIEVAFEQSLHTCVRQIRMALGDRASNPQYVQTIPRRGYRFVGTVDHAAETIPIRRPQAGRRNRRIALAAGAGLAVLLTMALFRFTAEQPTPPTRIAVMPFEPTHAASVLARDNDVAETVVKILASRQRPAMEIIGPTTTQLYDRRSGGIRELIGDLDIDYVVNARASISDSGERLLIEIIRGRDSAHVWASYWEELPTGRRPAETIAEAMADRVP